MLAELTENKELRSDPLRGLEVYRVLSEWQQKARSERVRLPVLGLCALDSERAWSLFLPRRADPRENYKSLTLQLLSLMSRIEQKPNIRGIRTMSGVFSLAIFGGHFLYLLQNSGKLWGGGAGTPLGV